MSLGRTENRRTTGAGAGLTIVSATPSRSQPDEMPVPIELKSR